MNDAYAQWIGPVSDNSRAKSFVTAFLKFASAACSALWATGYAHCDLHDGNFVAQVTEQGQLDFRIIDLEMACPVDSAVARKPDPDASADERRPSSLTEELQRWWFSNGEENNVVLDFLCVLVTALT
jgi:hypothetical protein